MANTPIHGKATEEQMKALEDALRGEGDKAIKAPWHIDGLLWNVAAAPTAAVAARTALVLAEEEVRRRASSLLLNITCGA